MRLFFYVRRIGFSLLWRPDERTENPRDDNLLLCCASRPFPSPSSVRPSSALDGVPTPGAMVHTVLMAISPVDNTSSLPSPLGPLPPSPARQAIPLSFPPRALSQPSPSLGSLPLRTVCPSPSFSPRALPFYQTARAPHLSCFPSVPPICIASLAPSVPPRRSFLLSPSYPLFLLLPKLLSVSLLKRSGRSAAVPPSGPHSSPVSRSIPSAVLWSSVARNGYDDPIGHPAAAKILCTSPPPTRSLPA